MTKTKYLFPTVTSMLKFIKQGFIPTSGAIVLLLAAQSTALAAHNNQHHYEKSTQSVAAYYNFKTYPSYNINSNSTYYSSYNQNANPSATVQFCQYEQGWQSGQSGQSGESGQYGQSGQVDHLGQSELQIYTNEQGDEVMRTTPTPQRNNEQGNTYYISPQIYPMPNGHGYPPPHFRPGQKPNPRPKP